MLAFCGQNGFVRARREFVGVVEGGWWWSGQEWRWFRLDQWWWKWLHMTCV